MRATTCIMPVDRISYIDTFAIWMQVRPEQSDIDAIRALCGHLDVKPRVFYKNSLLDSRYKWRLNLHQPTPEAITLLDDITTWGQFLINDVHIALDLTVSTYSELDTLREYLDCHLSEIAPM